MDDQTNESILVLDILGKSTWQSVDFSEDRAILIFRTIKKFVNHYKKIGYRMYVKQHTACMFVNPIMADNFASHFNCMTVSPASVWITALHLVCFMHA